MKKMLIAFTALLTLAVLTGCCSEKCPPKHRHTASCTGTECGEDEKDNAKNDNKTASGECGRDKKDQEKECDKTAMDDAGDKNGKGGENPERNTRKLSAR